MYEHILVPTDGSEETAEAVEHATDLARTYGATLHVISVVDTRTLTPDVRADFVLDQLESTAKEAVDDVVSQVGETEPNNVTSSVVRGVPHREILDYAATHDVDLIVMGTHGRTGLDRYLLGSVTEKVVRQSDVPVLTVRMSAGEEETNQT